MDGSFKQCTERAHLANAPSWAAALRSARAISETTCTRSDGATPRRPNTRGYLLRVQDKLAIYETAGALKGGRHIWMLARLPKTLRAAGDDEIKPYVLLANSHNGTRALRMIPTTIRVVCANTLVVA